MIRIKSKNKTFKLNVYEERIIRLMRMYYDSMAINEIADESGIHWKTAEIHLKKLKKKGLVNRKIVDGRILWDAKRLNTSSNINII